MNRRTITLLSTDYLLEKLLFLFVVFFFNNCTTGSRILSSSKFERKVDSLIIKSVPLIDCKRLSQKMKKGTFYLLDVRETEEYEVSHLKNAQCVGYEKFALDSIAHIPKSATVVIYCSIGYRSEKIGEKLKEAGYDNVFNLYGGVFEWANLSLPLYNQHGRSNYIHPYDKSWEKWLSNGLIKMY